MPPKLNHQVRLKSRPTGIPQAGHFEIVAAAMPDVADGQLLIRNEYLSIEPAMRGWVSAVANYSTPVAIGEVMRAFSAGKVIASRHPDYAEGDAVMGMLGWQQYALSNGSSITRKVKETDLPLSLSLGILGLNGVTAYFGLLDLGQPRPGDTVVVSTAAGAVGSAVGQIAKLMGCRTVGITGGPVKRSSAATSSATTSPSTTRPATILATHYRPPARAASTFISTTPRAPSAMRCWHGSLWVRGW
jgi:NADPH-dependent curcumin reductase CurA